MTVSSKKPGFFLTFEGPEGAGKSSQIKILAQHLEQRGFSVVLTREPGGTMLAEQLRDLLKHPPAGETLHDETELLLMEAARSQHVREVIAPALRAGKVVLCDRFYDSTTAYQGAARGLALAEIDHLNRFAVGDCRPQLTFLLDLAPEVGFARAKTRGGTDRIEAAGLEFHHKVRQAFLDLARQEPERIKIINADRPADEISAEIRSLADEFIR